MDDQNSVAEDPETIVVGDAEKETVVVGVSVTLAVTFTTTLLDTPPQVIVYVVLAVGLTDCVPEVAFVPVHPPDAVQLVALVEDHVRVAEDPETMDEADDERATVGVTTVVVTFTVTLFVSVPPVPVHAIVYVVLAVGVTDCVPDVAFVPVQPPEAIQLVALVDDHVIVAEDPERIDEEEDDSETVGVNISVTLGVTFTTTLLATPPQVMVYVLVLVGVTV